MVRVCAVPFGAGAQFSAVKIGAGGHVGAVKVARPICRDSAGFPFSAGISICLGIALIRDPDCVLRTKEALYRS